VVQEKERERSGPFGLGKKKKKKKKKKTKKKNKTKKKKKKKKKKKQNTTHVAGPWEQDRNLMRVESNEKCKRMGETPKKGCFPAGEGEKGVPANYDLFRAKGEKGETRRALSFLGTKDESSVPKEGISVENQLAIHPVVLEENGSRWEEGGKRDQTEGLGGETHGKGERK